MIISLVCLYQIASPKELKPLDKNAVWHIFQISLAVLINHQLHSFPAYFETRTGLGLGPGLGLEENPDSRKTRTRTRKKSGLVFKKTRT
jgi:hypothetical protein